MPSRKITWWTLDSCLKKYRTWSTKLNSYCPRNRHLKSNLTKFKTSIPTPSQMKKTWRISMATLMINFKNTRINLTWKIAKLQKCKRKSISWNIIWRSLTCSMTNYKMWSNKRTNMRSWRKNHSRQWSTGRRRRRRRTSRYKAWRLTRIWTTWTLITISITINFLKIQIKKSSRRLTTSTKRKTRTRAFQC